MRLNKHYKYIYALLVHFGVIAARVFPNTRKLATLLPPALEP